jgi:putative DNA primase/helicase
LHTFERADYITKIIETPYTPEAKCPLWEGFLLQIMGGKSHLVDFIRRVVGYCLTGSVAEQRLFVLHGNGSNGKSTLLGEGRKLDEPLVKQATGSDAITCRRMREDFWQYTPEFKLFLAINFKPIIKGTDNAIWRRVRLIPFDVVIPEAQRDKGLMSKLLEEAPGILAWAVRGCLDWQKSGLRAPDEVLAATEEYRHEQDVLGAFLDECCLVEPGLRDTARNLYGAYTQWAKDNGVFCWSCKKLMADLAARGFDECWHLSLRGRAGLAVKPQPYLS